MSLCKVTCCVCFPERQTEKGPLNLDKITRYLNQRAMDFSTLLSLPNSRWRTIKGVCWVESGDTEVFESWFSVGSISLCNRTDLHVVHGGILTSVICHYEITDKYVCTYACAIAHDFLLVDNNLRLYRAVVECVWFL